MLYAEQYKTHQVAIIGPTMEVLEPLKDKIRQVDKKAILSDHLRPIVCTKEHRCGFLLSPDVITFSKACELVQTLTTVKKRGRPKGKKRGRPRSNYSHLDETTRSRRERLSRQNRKYYLKRQRKT